MAVVDDSAPDIHCIQRRRSVGKLANLAAALRDQPLKGHVGMGHTRWATHGGVLRPTLTSQPIAMAYRRHPNGIVENYRELKPSSWPKVYRFTSQTDTEVIAHLISQYYAKGQRPLAEAVRMALKQLKAPSAVVVMSALEPHRLVAARLGNAGGVVLAMRGRDVHRFRYASNPRPHPKDGLPRPPRAGCSGCERRRDH